MHLLNKRTRLLCLGLCLLLLSAAAPCLAQSGGTLTVRVGFFAFDGYHEQTGNARDGFVRSGYGYDLLQHLAGHAGLRYEYVGYDKSWQEMQDMLARGEIDLLTSAQKTPEREERFDFSDASIGVSAAVLTVKAGDTAYMGTEANSWDGIRVGMIRGNSRNESFAAYAAENGFTYLPVFFNSTDEMIVQLQSEQSDRPIDAILTSNLRKTDNEWVLAQFDASPFYIMVRKGNDALLSRINKGIAQMDVCEPGLRTDLMNRYYGTDSSGEIAFSAEERAWIDSVQGQELTAIINPDRAPYSFVQDGVMCGIVYDAAQEIIARSGLPIRILNITDADAYYLAVDAGEADIRFEIADSYNRAEQEGCWLTDPFLTVSMAKVYREGTTAFRTAAEPQNRGLADDYATLLRSFGLETVFYPTVAEAVDAVLTGKQDVSYLTIDSANMAIRHDVTNRLVCEEVFGRETSYAVAVCSDLDPMLYSVLNKAAASVTRGEMDAFRQQYAAGMQKPFTLVGFFYDYPLRAMGLVMAALAVCAMIAALVFLTRRRKAELTHLERELRQNGLLSDALAAAERADSAKSAFLSRVSHEMRTPLNAIIGFIDLAKDADREQMQNYLASTDIAAKQLLSVINDVLDMSSIESGKLKIGSAPFHFKKLVSQLTNIYGTQCRQKNVAFETRMLTPADDWLIGDEMRVNQILMNLLGNAVKFTAAGSVCLTIAETPMNEDTAIVRFTVSDTGCGMSEQMLARLFRPFEQESASTARKYGGSGLGLSIVKSLTGMMGGTVSAQSQPNAGTVFTVDLPFGKYASGTVAALSDRAKRLRILAVDDKQNEREYLSAMLTRMGVRYRCAASGAEALDALAQSERDDDLFNVCLVDWRMPGMDGADTTALIRQRYGEDIIVIVVSAYEFEHADARAKEAGANLFLSKPLFQSSLFDMLMSLTGGEIAITREEPSTWDFAGKRVLLVEDNTLNQIVARAILTKMNLVVDVSEDGQKAVDAFVSSAPGFYDAILMDVQMPVMDGFEATRAIRACAHPDAKTVPIIAQTADAFQEDITKALSAGMNAHVSKPIKLSVLARTLRNVFALPRQTRETE